MNEQAPGLLGGNPMAGAAPMPGPGGGGGGLIALVKQFMAAGMDQQSAEMMAAKTMLQGAQGMPQQAMPGIPPR